MENRSFRDAGGTPGGLGEFLIGFVMAASDVVRGRHSLLEWTKHSRLAAYCGRSTFYPGRSDRQHAHLLSANQPVQHGCDVNPACGRVGADRPVASLASERAADLVNSSASVE